MGGERELVDMLARMRPYLRSQARGLLGPRFLSRADSSDLVQECLTQAYQDFHRFRGQSMGELASWLRRILLIQAGRVMRHHLAGKRTVRREANASSSLAADSPHVRPDIRAMDDERLAQLADALSALPEVMRRIVVHRVFHNRSFEEIGEEIGRSPGSTRGLWARALQRLRSSMNGYDGPSHRHLTARR